MFQEKRQRVVSQKHNQAKICREKSHDSEQIFS